MYLLDTNTLIYFFKGLGKVAENILSHSPKDITIPAIVLFELEVGIVKSNYPTQKRQQLESFVSQITIIPFEAKAARFAAAVRTNLEKLGMPIGPYDTLIAGTALSANSTLVTHNTKEFSRIVNLSIEDWF